MKIAIITDTHYNFKKANKNFHDYFAKFYNNIFFPYLEEKNIKVVFHLGDAFDNRKGIDYWALKWAKENVYDKFKDLGITVYNIVGNHDTYYKNTNKVNAIDTLLEEYDNVIKVSTPKEFTVGGCDFLMMPWICADNQEEVFSVIDSTKAKVALGHLELSDFPVFPGQLQPQGMDKKIFQKFDRVFTGHYHTRSDDGKIFYVGNPYQMFWNDVDDKRGFNIFDTDSYELTHIENPFKIFKKLYYEDTEVKDLDISDLQDKIVKLVVNKKSNQKKFDKYLDKVSSAKYIELKITELLDVDDSNFQESEYDVENTLVFLDKYIDESEFDLDKGIIKKIIKDVYIEALEIE